MKRLLYLVVSAAMLVGCAGSESSSVKSESLSDTQSLTSASDSAEQTTSQPTEDFPITTSEKDESEAGTTKLIVNGESFEVEFENNPSAEAFKAKLPIELKMSELNGNEKYYDFGESLPSDDIRPNKIKAGDIMLYSSSYVVVFYKSFSTSYSYTPLGRVKDPQGLAKALGKSSVTVRFE